MALKIGISVLYLLLSVLAIKLSHILLTWHQKQQEERGIHNKETHRIFDKKAKNILYVLFMLFSAVLGYFTAQNAVDTFAIVRLTLLYFILAVAAIVDGEKYIIPNI